MGEVGVDAVAELIERRQRGVGGSGRSQVFDRALDERGKERPLGGEIVVQQPAGDARHLGDPLDVHPLVGLRGEQLGAEVQQLLAAELGSKSSACHSRILLDMSSVVRKYY